MLNFEAEFQVKMAYVAVVFAIVVAIALGVVLWWRGLLS
jgi:hypothetical protein